MDDITIIKDDYRLLLGDCLDRMKEIPDGSVDMVLCDLPYGTTKNKWDIQIPISELWEQYKRIIKEHGAIVLFSQLPFSVDLIQGNRKIYRYEWIWDKKAPAGFLNANKMPLRVHENILVFYKHLPTYNPQKTEGKPYKTTSGRMSSNYDRKWQYRAVTDNDGTRFPRDVIRFAHDKERYHPTQKPVALLEYLIRTYTNPGETVLDNCMGSGSTGVACINTGRKFIGIEKDEGYFGISSERIERAVDQQALLYTE